MAYKLIWSPAALDDLHDIVVFIARDNSDRAMSFGYELISETDKASPSSAAKFLNTRIQTFARSSFGLTGLSIELITSEGSVRLPASGIRLAECQGCDRTLTPFTNF